MIFFPPISQLVIPLVIWAGGQPENQDPRKIWTSPKFEDIWKLYFTSAFQWINIAAAAVFFYIHFPKNVPHLKEGSEQENSWKIANTKEWRKPQELFPFF